MLLIVAALNLVAAALMLTAVVLMVAGIAMFGIVTASITAYFVERRAWYFRCLRVTAAGGATLTSPGPQAPQRDQAASPISR